MATNFFSNSVEVLQQYLRARGVVIANQRKLDLVRLCEAAEEIGIEVDPDGLLEDREEILKEKLTTHDNEMLKNPVLEVKSDDLSKLPQISIFDIYNYLLGFKMYDHSTLRNYQRMEGYSMFEDGYVLDVKTTTCSSDNGQHDKYFAIISNVKPRTNEKDPVSKKPYYLTWIIVTKEESHQRGSIYSAYCSCKGGVDGACRHVVATLFEVIDFVQDSKKESVTSGSCKWVKRVKGNEDPILITLLETSYVRETGTSTPRPTEDKYTPIDEDTPLPDKDLFFDLVKEACPSACILDNIEVRRKRKNREKVNELKTQTPMDKIQTFFETHHCIKPVCDDQCIDNFGEMLKYNMNDIRSIECGTRGQHENENWHRARKGLLTASRFKDVIHSRDQDAMAQRLLTPSTLDEDTLPAAIQFGRNYENKARVMFIKSHRYHHRKCSYFVPGLMVSKSNAFLGASPDGVVKCSICGEFLVEIKCFFSQKNFHPKNALIVSKVCEKVDDNTLRMIPSHKYFYQIQGQLAVSGLEKCILVAYTQKGIYTVDVTFDKDFWDEAERRLSNFYRKYMYSALKNIEETKINTDN